MNAYTTDQADRQPTYRDAPLMKLIKQLRVDVRPHPQAKKSLERVEGRLRYVLRVLEASDQAHAERAEMFLSFGLVQQANTEASLIWDDTLRSSLLNRARIGLDQHDRLEEAKALGREVLA